MGDQESLDTTEQSPITPEWPEYDEARRLSKNLLERLDLNPGYHVFRIDGDKYNRIDVTYRPPGQSGFALYSVPEIWGSGAQGQPYSFQRQSSVWRFPDDNLNYDVTDVLQYKYKGEDDTDTDSELSSDSEEVEPSEVLSDKISSLLAEVSGLLPGLTLEQYDEENSEPDEEVDPATQAQLGALEQELHTAGGALGLFQLALLEKLRDSTELAELSAEGRSEVTFKLPASSSDSYRVRASHDPVPGEPEEAWQPHTVSVERSRQAYFYGAQLIEIATHTFYKPDLAPQAVNHEFSSVLINKILSDSMTLNSFDRAYQADEALDGEIFVLARHVLDVIVNGEIVNPEKS